jgi:hypothetical protein
VAFKLSKEELRTRARIVECLREQRSKLEDAVNVYNEAIGGLTEALQQAVANYNDEVGAARDFAEGIVSEADSQISDKSEKWLEGDKGQAAESWKSEWEGLSFDDVEIDTPDAVEFDAEDYADALEGAPEEAEG